MEPDRAESEAQPRYFRYLDGPGGKTSMEKETR